VEVLYREENLGEVEAGQVFGELALALEVEEELSPCAKISYEVEVLLLENEG